jgi:hypothetical protein
MPERLVYPETPPVPALTAAMCFRMPFASFKISAKWFRRDLDTCAQDQVLEREVFGTKL